MADEGVSRRRLAFRPPVKLDGDENSEAASTSQATQQKAESTMTATTTSEASSGEEIVKKKTAKSWTPDHVLAYYDGLKMYGKDFESVARMLQKRKIAKDKDQIKNYFYNSLKVFKQLLAIDEDDMGDVPKDAKELFVALNACEWKKRTGNAKLNAEKVRELLFDGQTSVRVNRKTILIKTPPCPSLVKWFTSTRRVDKIPNELTIVLRPKSNGDAAHLKQFMQNTLVKMRVSTNERITRLLEFLERKWTANAVRLWPSCGTQLGKLRIVETDVSPFVAVSLNKLRKEVENATAKKRGGTRETPEPVIQPASSNINSNPSYSVVYPKPFVLNDEIMKDGISATNSENAIFAELYCACGMTDEIEMRYEIICEAPEYEFQRRKEPWMVMVDLLSRDYGEALCCARRDGGGETATAENRKRVERDVVDECEPPPPKKPAPPPTEIAVVAASDVVQRENDDFAMQIAMLKTTKGTKKPLQLPRRRQDSVRSQFSVPQRIPQKFVQPLNTSTNSVNNQNTSVSNNVRLAAKAEIVKEKKIDFSHKLTASVLFGEDISMSPSTTKKSAPPPPPSRDDEGSRCELTEILFGEISSTPTKYPANPQGGLGFTDVEVQQSYEDLISSSEDSRDFVLKHFTGRKCAPKRKL
ncbi:unnamed protein product [Caenorhabditis bovis]|uniref:SANT domain-containing protein n=1 Tax=Caenorhabditis bovis TaxID=2654633 RepID=A0A8S1EN93_9PELO|nr:unnamed protein product [Caenorhabditis bovis]